MAAAQLPRDPLQTPPARLKAQHLYHIVRRLHHLPPWINPRKAFCDSFLVHSLSPQLSKEGAIRVLLAEVKSATDKLGKSQQRWLRDSRERLHFPFKLIEVRKMELETVAGA
jgi:hypothetical protein